MTNGTQQYNEDYAIEWAEARGKTYKQARLYWTRQLRSTATELDKYNEKSTMTRDDYQIEEFKRWIAKCYEMIALYEDLIKKH